MDDFSVGDTSAMEWTEAAVGVDVKLIGAADGRLFTMSRFAPGFSAPLHTHVDTEFGYVVEGSVQSQGQLLTAGCGYAAPIGTTHEEFVVSDEGCTMLFVLKAPTP
jgi:anti-sigma factor ChrR (cupin superfamily)